MRQERSIAVVGLGYVGLPVAVSFAKAGMDVVGFDIDESRVAELRAGHDRTNELTAGDLKSAGLRLTGDIADLKGSDFFVITVPTPVDEHNRPDLTALSNACGTVGGVIRQGDIVVFESTVYPGATRNICCPILEAESGLRLNVDFFVGYSPERINPGDRQHRFENIMKVVSASTPEALDIVADVYGAVVKAGIHRAPSLEVAEAAKVIENTQRDLNIALMNEFAIILGRLDVDTHDVLAAAGTKWNFLNFMPGLVGGHCVGVDPYYLTHCAEETGYRPEVILSGRRINDHMGSFVVEEAAARVLAAGGSAADKTVTVLGVTFKENVPDTRNSRMRDVIVALQTRGFKVQAYDPVADAAAVRREWQIELCDRSDLIPGDAVILGVPHREFVDEGWALVEGLLNDGKGFVADVKCCLERSEKPADVELWRL
ncbi:MAG: nucleotide sugar dehydrogenase [Rhodospirillales bacterium]